MNASDIIFSMQPDFETVTSAGYSLPVNFDDYDGCSRAAVKAEAITEDEYIDNLNVFAACLRDCADLIRHPEKVKLATAESFLILSLDSEPEYHSADAPLSGIPYRHYDSIRRLLRTDSSLQGRVRAFLKPLEVLSDPERGYDGIESNGIRLYGYTIKSIRDLDSICE